MEVGEQVGVQRVVEVVEKVNEQMDVQQVVEAVHKVSKQAGVQQVVAVEKVKVEVEVAVQVWWERCVDLVQVEWGPMY